MLRHIAYCALSGNFLLRPICATVGDSSPVNVHSGQNVFQAGCSVSTFRDRTLSNHKGRLLDDHLQQLNPVNHSEPSEGRAIDRQLCAGHGVSPVIAWDLTCAMFARGKMSRSASSLSARACGLAAMSANVLGFITDNLLLSSGRSSASSLSR